MKQNQLDTLRLNICIKAVWLAVRFNCKLSFVLKNDLSEVLAHTENSYPLNRGEAIINDYLSCPIPPQLYTPTRKIRLFVYLVSANGIVPAGFAVLPCQNKQKSTGLSYMLSLERCDDPKAHIKIILSVDNSNKLSTMTNNEVIRNVDNKRLNSPISNLEMYRDTSRSSYSAAKIQNSKLRQNAPSHSYLNGRQLKIISPEKKLQKQPDSDLSRQQLIKEHQQYWVEIVRMESQNESLKEELSILRNQNETFKNNFQMIRIDNQGLRLENEKIYALVSEVNQGNQTISKLQAELYAFKQKYSTSENQCYSLSQHLKRSQLQLKEAFEEVTKLNFRILAQISQAETNKQIIQNLKWEKSHIIEQIQGLKNQNIVNKYQNSMLIDQNQKLRNQICQFQLQIPRLKLSTQQLQGFKNRIEKSKQKVIQLQNDNQILRSQLQSLKQKNMVLQQEFGLVGQLLKKQQQEKQSLINSINQLEQVREAFEVKQADFKRQQIQQSQLLSNLRHQLESTKSAKDSAQNQVIILEVTLRQTQLIKNKLEQDFKAISYQNRQLKNRINELQADLECFNLQITELRQKQAKTQYYDSYNKSITQITLNQIKVEKEKNELARKYEEAKLYAEQKQKELNKTKEFAKNNLQEILKLRREKEELQTELSKK